MISLAVTWYNKSGSVDPESQKVFSWAVKENVLLPLFLHARSQPASHSFLNRLAVASGIHFLRTNPSLRCRGSHAVTMQGPSLHILDGFMMAVSHLDRLIIGRSPLSLPPPGLAAGAEVQIKKLL